MITCKISQSELYSVFPSSTASFLVQAVSSARLLSLRKISHVIWVEFGNKGTLLTRTIKFIYDQLEVKRIQVTEINQFRCSFIHIRL
jgi:hypothetical protein